MRLTSRELRGAASGRYLCSYILVAGFMFPSRLVCQVNIPPMPCESEAGPALQATRVRTETLVEQFKNEKVFWRQFSIAAQIAERNDPRALPSLVGWLRHDDRHIRGNVAFIFARLGDPRGFLTITAILTDRSDRPEGQGATAPSDGAYRPSHQIAADRYYAAHLLGDLRDPSGVLVLVALLNDPDVRSIVPWALAQIGDQRAVAPLLDVLDQDDPTMRVLAIYALDTLRATEALPRLVSLLDDHRRSNFGTQVSVSDAAKGAIAKLK